MSNTTARTSRRWWIAIPVLILLILAALFLWRGQEKPEEIPTEGLVQRAGNDWNALASAGVDVAVAPAAGAEQITFEIWSWQDGGWAPVEDEACTLVVDWEKPVEKQLVALTGQADGSFRLGFPLNGKELGEQALSLSFGPVDYEAGYVTAGWFGNLDKGDVSPGLNTPVPVLYIGYTADYENCADCKLDLNDFYRPEGPSDYPVACDGYRMLTVTFS